MTLTAIDLQMPDADQAFVESLRTTGFGVLRNHRMSRSLVETIYQQWAAFFRSSEKFDYRFHPDTQDGYYSSEDAEKAKDYSQQDIKEYFHFYPWGQCPASLRTNLEIYYREAHELAATLLRWIEQACPEQVRRNFSEPLSDMINGSEQTLLRILHYPPLTGSENGNAVRAAAHEDINLLTILPAASMIGLQVLSNDGKWIEVPCDFDNVIVNAGDMLQEASGGFFRSTKHRVINPASDQVNVSRMSLPLFLHPRPEVVLSSRHTAASYLAERLQELGVT